MPVYKDEKRKTWYVSVSYKNYDGVTARKVKRGFSTQRDAKQWEREFLNTTAESPQISFDKLCDLYLAYIEKRLKASTHYIRKQHIDNTIRPAFKNYPIAEITPAVVTLWQDGLIKKYAPSTQRHINTIFSMVMNHAIKFYGLKENPCKVAGIVGTQKRDKNKINFWTTDEFKKVITCVPADTIDYVIFNLLYFSGIRLGEMLALTVADFNQQEGYIDINKTLNYSHKKAYTTPPKTEASNRKVYMPVDVCELLKKLDTVSTANQNQRLFTIAPTTIREHLNNASKKAGIRRIRIHDLRHSHASLLIDLGTPPLAISERLGHENVTTTLKIYAHLFPNKQGDIIKNLDEVFKQTTSQSIHSNPIEN